MQKLVFYFILIFIFQPASATVIRGLNKEYTGKKIKFYRYTDPVTNNEEFVFQLKFDKYGNFKTDVKIKNTEFVFAEFGIYKGLLFLEPEKSIELSFPPLREKSFADEKNPFFEPVSFWIETQTKDQLTDKISLFDQKFSKLTDQFFNYLYFRQSREIFDSVVTILNKEFTDDVSEVLTVHKKLRIKTLESDVFRLKTENVSQLLSTISSQYWNYQSFTEYFNKVFSNQLSVEVKSVKGSELRKAVANANTNYLLDFVRHKYLMDGRQAIELVALKMLHDGFYSGEFSKESILKMLNSPLLKESPNGIIGDITTLVIYKLEFLTPGSKAPVVCLKDVDGNRICTNENQDKYKYLLFADTEMIVCREHLKYLSEIQKKFEKYLEIIVVLRKTDLIEMKIFFDNQQIPGVKLVDSDGKFIDEYRIRSFPAAFLFNDKHEVVFQHTKSPLDGFEQQFGPYLQKELFMQQRNQPR